MRSIKTSIIINVEPWEVWDVLLKFHEYDNWNPIYKYLSGSPKLGAIVKIESQMDFNVIEQYADEESAQILQSVKIKKTTNRHRIKKLKENEILEWEGKILSGLFIHAIHTFELHAADEDKTLLVNTEQIGGYIGNLMPDKIFYSFYKAVNIAFNESLKDYVEKEESKRF